MEVVTEVLLGPVGNMLTVISIAEKIKKVYDNVKGNKEQCKVLNDQVQFVTSTLKKLPDVNKRKTEIQATITPLIKTLRDCLDLIGEFQGEHWLKKCMFHGSIAKNFEVLINQLDRHRSNCGFALSVRLQCIFSPQEITA